MNDLCERFGRIVCDPDKFRGEPHLGRKQIPVKKILHMLGNGLKDDDILDRVPHLEPSDIDACRAFKARFYFQEQEAGRPYFLVDENISYLVLAEIVELFGSSSHVLAEGLYHEHNDDEHDILQHAIDNHYRAILTGDSDFQRIATRRRRDESHTQTEMPAIIYIPRGRNRDVKALLNHYVEDIKRFVDQNLSPYANLTAEGVYAAGIGKRARYCPQADRDSPYHGLASPAFCF